MHSIFCESANRHVTPTPTSCVLLPISVYNNNSIIATRQILVGLKLFMTYNAKHDNKSNACMLTSASVSAE